MFGLEVITKVAERKIQDAIDEGKLDNLPGKGKPLDLDVEAGVPLHQRLANQVLKNANVLPEWVQLQKEIQCAGDAIASYKARLLNENARWERRLKNPHIPQSTLAEYQSFHADGRNKFLRLLKEINTSILKFSMTAPSTAPPFFLLKVEAEMSAFDTEFIQHQKG